MPAFVCALPGRHGGNLTKTRLDSDHRIPAGVLALSGSQHPVPSPIDLTREAARTCAGLSITPREGMVVVGSDSVRLEPRLMQVLVALADAYPGAATRSELAARAWSNVIVGEDALNRCIARLRAALRAVGSEARIETLPKLGYRLAGPACMAALASPTGAAPRPVSALSPQVWKRVALFGCAALAVAGVGAAFLPARPGVQPLWAFGTVRPLPSAGERTFDPALSPDGRAIAYARLDGRDSLGIDLFMMPIEGGAERRLTHDGGAINPAWSPDGAQIAYVVVREGRPCEIRLAPAAGGLSRRLTSCPTTETTSLTWARDGSALYFDDAMSAGAPRRLLRLTLRTGSVTPVTRPASGAGDMLAAVSPDGRRIAFLREQGWLTGDVMLLDLATQAIRRLEAAPSDVRGIAWSPDGASLIVSSTWGGDTGLWRLGLEGQPPVRLAGAGGMVGSVSAPAPARARSAASGASGRLAFEVRSLERALTVLGDRSTADAVAVAGRGIDTDPDVRGSDGEIVFVSRRSGAHQLWRAAPGAAPRRLTQAATHYMGGARWAPDGRSIAVSQADGSGQDIVIHGENGGPARRVTSDAAVDIAPQWIEGGRAILFASDRGGEWGLWRADLATGQLSLVQARADAGVLGEDGTLVYRDTGTGRLLARRAGAAVSQPLDLPVPTSSVRLSWHDGRFFVMDRTSLDDVAIRAVAPDFTVSAPLWSGAFEIKSQLAFMPEGRPLVSMRTRTDSQVFVADLVNPAA